MMLQLVSYLFTPSKGVIEGTDISFFWDAPRNGAIGVSVEGSNSGPHTYYWGDYASLPVSTEWTAKIVSKEPFGKILMSRYGSKDSLITNGNYWFEGNFEAILRKLGFPELPGYQLELEFCNTLTGETERQKVAVKPYFQGRIVSCDEKHYTLEGNWFGEAFSVTLPLQNVDFPARGKASYYSREEDITVTFQAVTLAEHLFAFCECDEEIRLKGIAGRISANVVDLKGIAKEAAIIKQVAALDPLAGTLLGGLTSSKTSNKIQRNKLIKVFLQAVKDPAQVALEVRKAFNHKGTLDLDTVAKRLPGADTQLALEEEKRDWTKRKEATARAEGLGLNASNYPLLYAAICDEEISTGVFNQPGQQGQPVNREFDVWEEALAQEGWAETIYNVAKNAAGRSTYEREITPWLLFMLHSLPEYLNKHAPLKNGASWKCMPKHVTSTWELEMAEADENGTVKRRSAMTPVADNEAGIVTVPYVSLSVGGARTQWCYSRHYYIFRKGFTDPESGGVVTKDVELKLNGKDDYGLMYYDLNGTSTAQGYPTFLVIFEQRQTGPYVHFHRVRPCRTKDGVKTPACNLIEACYQYMAGNVPASDIVAQQGDIMLLRVASDPITNGAKVSDTKMSGREVGFESHTFVGPLSFYRSEAKTPKNRLGFIFAPEGLEVTHPEHDDIPRLPAGWYEVRRAVSWEANPVSISSYSID